MQALENLAGTGQLIPEATSVEEISGFLMRAEQQLVDARTASLSVASRSSLAYDAAHAFALIALRVHGYRPGRGLGHRIVVFSTLVHTVASPCCGMCGASTLPHQAQFLGVRRPGKCVRGRSARPDRGDQFLAR